MTQTETFYGVSEAAERIGALPRDLTRMFYNRQLRCDVCPLVSGRRIVPESYLELIARELRRNGKQVNFEGIICGGQNG